MAKIDYDLTKVETVSGKLEELEELLARTPTHKPYTKKKSKPKYYNELEKWGKYLLRTYEHNKGVPLQVLNAKTLDRIVRRVYKRVEWKKQNMKSTTPIFTPTLFNELVPLFLEICEQTGKAPYVNRLAVWCGIPAEFIECLPKLNPTEWAKYEYSYKLLESSAALRLMDTALDSKSSKGAEIILTHFFGKMSAKDSKKLQQEQERIEISRTKKSVDNEELQGAIGLNILQAIYGKVSTDD